jgi:hypothetical protein
MMIIGANYLVYSIKMNLLSYLFKELHKRRC